MGKCFSVPEYHLVSTALDIEIIETRLSNIERKVDDMNQKLIVLQKHDETSQGNSRLYTSCSS